MSGLAVATLLSATACGPRRQPASIAPATQPPGAAETLYQEGHLLLRQRDFSGAAETFDRCIEAEPNHAYAHYYAGMAYREVGRLDLMALRFESFLDLAPDAPERPRVRAILRALEG